MQCSQEGCKRFPTLKGLCGWCYRSIHRKCPTCGKHASKCDAYVDKGTA